jgi:hypothetical protein
MKERTCLWMVLALVLIRICARSDPAQEVNAQDGGTFAEVASAMPGDNLAEVRFKLQRIGQAFQLHQQHWKRLPPPRDRDGTVDGVGLSWRVHLLPFVGEPDLYEEFRFDESWESSHNQRLLDRMPEIYRLGGENGSKSRFQVFGGNDTPLGVGHTSDGPSNTILVAVAGADRGTPWTSPENLPFDEEDPRDALGVLPGRNIECVMADGRLLTIGPNVNAQTLCALITASRGDVADADALRGPSMPSPGNLLSGLQGLLGRRPQVDAAQKQLKQLGLAMLNYHDTYRRFPVAGPEDRFDDQGHPRLSWRVHLLPFLQQQPLYDKFRLNEPWDSPHNKALIRFMPQVFRTPADPADSTTTRMVTIVGEGTLFDPALKQRMADVRDGTAQTLLIIHVGRDKAVPWTKPEDVRFDPSQPLACLGTISSRGIPFVRVDGAVHVFSPNVSPFVFSAMVTPKGGEILDGRQLREAILTQN